MPLFERDGLEFHYETWGDPAAPALVLLHGFTGNLRMWYPHAPALSDRYFVVAPDLRGHGLSAAPGDPGAYAATEYASDLEALLDALSIEVCALTGSSFGGMVALQFATASPGRVAALCLTDTSPAYASDRYDEAYLERERRIDEWDDIVQRFGMAELGKRQAATITDPFLADGVRKRFAAMSPAGFSGAAHMRRTRPDLVASLAPSLTMPVLLCTGDRDPVRCAFEVMAGELPGARALTFRDCGHGVPSIRSEAFLNALLQFLTDVEEGRPVAGRRTV